MNSANSFSLGEWLGQDVHNGPCIITKPRQLACWTRNSVTQGNQYLYGDSSGLLNYHDPPLPSDLNEGFPDAYIRKQDDGVATPVDVIIEAAQQANIDLKQAGVVSFRNNLNKICMTPFAPQDAWDVDACLVRSTLYLDIVKRPEATFEGAAKFEYYGYKFEALCTSSEADSDGHQQQQQGPQVVDATSEHAVVVSLSLGRHKVLMGAEVDCCDPQLSGGPDPLAPLIELKQMRYPTNAHFRKKMYEQKYPRWYLQSFLAGVPTLVVGGRDQQGTLIKVERVPVQHMPSQAAAGGAAFDARKLFRFGDAILTFMRQQCAAQHTQLRFSYSPAHRTVTAAAVPGEPMLARVRALLD